MILVITSNRVVFIADASSIAVTTQAIVESRNAIDAALDVIIEGIIAMR